MKLFDLGEVNKLYAERKKLIIQREELECINWGSLVLYSDTKYEKSYDISHSEVIAKAVEYELERVNAALRLNEATLVQLGVEV